MTNQRPFKIKVCGMKDAANIEAVAALKPNYMGFIFYERSPRYAGYMDTEALDKLPESIKKTGVFVNGSIDLVLATIEKYSLDAVQLHGAEDHQYCKTLKGLKQVEIIKAFGIDDDFDFEKLKTYADAVDHFLFDTLSVDHGGSGKTFNWRLLDRYAGDRPFFLSGGITSEHIPDIQTLQSDQLFAVDINSRFELSPGIKAIEKLNIFFEKLNPKAKET